MKSMVQILKYLCVTVAVLVLLGAISLASFSYYQDKKITHSYHDDLSSALKDCSDKIPDANRSISQGGGNTLSAMSSKMMGIEPSASTDTSYSRYPAFDRCMASKGFQN